MSDEILLSEIVRLEGHIRELQAELDTYEFGTAQWATGASAMQAKIDEMTLAIKQAEEDFGTHIMPGPQP